MSSADSEGSHERSLSPPAEESLSPKPPDLNKGKSLHRSLCVLSARQMADEY